MAVSVFGVTAESVRAHYFPNFDALSTQSRPTLTVWTESVTAEAARLQGRLLKESINVSSVTADTSSAAYLMCADVLRLMVAQRLSRSIPGADSALAIAWGKSIDTWFEMLEKDGGTFLGDDTLSSASSDPDGPTDFISELGLSTGDDADASSAEPYLRRDDVL